MNSVTPEKKKIIINGGNIPTEDVYDYIKKLNKKYPKQLTFEVFFSTKPTLWQRLKEWLKHW